MKPASLDHRLIQTLETWIPGLGEGAFRAHPIRWGKRNRRRTFPRLPSLMWQGPAQKPALLALSKVTSLFCIMG